MSTTLSPHMPTTLPICKIIPTYLHDIFMHDITCASYTNLSVYKSSTIIRGEWERARPAAASFATSLLASDESPLVASTGWSNRGIFYLVRYSSRINDDRHTQNDVEQRNYSLLVFTVFTRPKPPRGIP